MPHPPTAEGFVAPKPFNQNMWIVEVCCHWWARYPKSSLEGLPSKHEFGASNCLSRFFRTRQRDQVPRQASLLGKLCFPSKLTLRAFFSRQTMTLGARTEFRKLRAATGFRGRWVSCGDFRWLAYGIWSPKHSLEIFNGIKGSSPTGKCGRASA